MQFQVKLLFEYFYLHIYRTAYNFDLDQIQNIKFVSSFESGLKKIISPEIIGVNFLIEYFAFAFYYYNEKELRRDIVPNWIIGKKMIKRFFERESGWDYYTSEFLREYNINVDEIKIRLHQISEEKEKNYWTISVSEEREKSRVSDTEARVYNCLKTTTLFNHRSVVCRTCNQKSFCRLLLKKVNPSLYDKRGYANKK